MLDKTFAPKTFESRHYEKAKAGGLFKPSNTGKNPFTLMMPPPNVTGTLHIGHALTFTLQDILVRYQRMNGRDTLWQAGTDHAGIATQMVVERQLAEKGTTRQELGREKFLEAVWAWKEESGNAIYAQMERLGVSADWSRARFTMDDGLSAAVRKIFVKLYNDGLIYKDKRLVNWDIKLQTAVSDLEVISKENKGQLYYIFYPLADNDTRAPQAEIVAGDDLVFDGHTIGGIIVATTRPETLFGDSAVAVHPDDARYTALIGKSVRLPLTERVIPIIADDYSDPEKGSGAVKITPAHDFNDFAVGKRHGLPFHNILSPDGTLNDTVPPEFIGLSREAARKKALAELQERGYLIKTQPITNMVPYGDRSGTVIEPYLTEQWYVDAAKLAVPALEAVRSGKTRFVPENWTKTYYQWLENIEPWCISRQLWWGHQIPAWYTPDGKIIVAEDELEAQKLAGIGVPLTRDPDVLDTWFSSGLWPFSTLGWPEQASDVALRYPTSTLVTGFDIIFFWVARMMMFGLYTQGDVPFRDVYIHALVRDATGAKMSKSKGNVIDPLVLCDKYGADALRFTLCRLATQGRDVKLSESTVESGRNFATKLWNAARYAEMNGCLPESPDFKRDAVQHPLNQWILQRLNLAVSAARDAVDAYKFNELADGLYHFLWDDFCDWYLEFTKPLLEGDLAAETKATTGHVLAKIIRLLHPVMPFITEELAENLGIGATHPALCVASYPKPVTLPAWQTGSIDQLITLIREIRSVRAALNVPAGAKIEAVIAPDAAEFAAFCAAQDELLLRLARLSAVKTAEVPSTGVVPVPVAGGTLYLNLTGQIDFAAERARLEKDRDALEKQLIQTESKLADPLFTSKAPEEVLDEYRERLEAGKAKQQQLAAALARLAA